MHSPNTTHTNSISKRLKARAKFIKRRIFPLHARQHLTVSALVLTSVLIGAIALAGYYGPRASAAPSAVSSIFTDSYASVSRGIQYLKHSLFGASHATNSNMMASVSIATTISGCYYSGGQSRATVSVEVSWSGLANSDVITVTLPGALNGTTRTITQNTSANPPIVTPQVVAFEIPATFSNTVTATTTGGGGGSDSKPVVSNTSCAPLVCGANDLGGTVFNDYNADGIKQAGETNGAAGVTVTAFDKNGATYTTTTNSAGRYCLTIPLANYPVRVEFTNIPSEFSGGFTTRQGADNGSTVQFYAAPNNSADIGVNNPVDYCQSNPKVLIPCFFFGDPLLSTGNMSTDAAAEPSMVRFDYNNDGVEIGVEKFAIASETGPVWGIAYKKTTGHLYGAATVRRHAGLGPQGLGGIYVINAKGPMGMGNVVDAWSVETQLGIDVQNPMSPFGGSTNPATSNANRGLAANKFTPSVDAQAFSAVGKIGLGDIDIAEDENSLWFVNQYDKKLYGVNIAGYNPAIPATRPTAANITVNTTIPDPGCVNGEWRPFGTKYRRGIVYVGGVCNAITSGMLSDLRASVQAYNIAGNSWTEIFNFPLTYPKGSPLSATGEKGWHAWTDSFATMLAGSNAGNSIVYSVPMFTDIEFDLDGTMVLGFNDRSGMQTGRDNYAPTGGTTLYTGFVGGDILRAFFSNGTYVLENNAKAGPTTGFSPNNNEGPGFGEFYEDNWRAPGGHTETTVGGLAILPGSGEVVSSSMDPHDSSIWAAGVRYMSNSTGARTHALAVYSDSNDPGSNTLGKSTGIGDVELRCETLNYIDLGNRLWMDANRNGIQDPGEMPIQGATVRLYQQGNNTAVATAVTAADGTYHFTSVDADNNGVADTDNNLNDNVGLVSGAGLLPNTNYVIRLDRAADYQFGGALYGKRLSSGNAGGGVYGTLPDLRDSDAVSGNVYGLPGGNYPEIVVQHLANGSPVSGTGGYGEVDHTMDFGFYLDFDFGDAPDPTFPTLLASNGARHVIVDGIRLGSVIDAEDDGQPTAGHNGDDNNGTPDDEDGVALPTLIAGQTAIIQVSASVAGRLNGWIDFNGDGDWNDTGEQVFNDTPVVAGVNNLTISVPLSAVQGNVCTRFRFTTSTGMATTPTGQAADGEVEDYLVTIIKNVSLGNQVFYDTNNNGLKDSGELGINGVTVELYNDTNMDNVPDTPFPLDRKTTATNGQAGMYLFTQQTLNTTTGATLGTPIDLLPGKYIICLPASNFTGSGALVGLWSSGTTAAANGTTTETDSPDPNIGGAVNNPGIDNDDNGFLSGGRVCSKWIDIGINEPLNENPYNNNDALVPDNLSNLTIDFGFYGLSVGNLVFKDNGAGANYNNATFDTGETGIQGVTVKLYAENGTTLLMTKATDANGKYLFPGLAAGKYFVEIDRTSAALTGLVSSKDGPNAGNTNATDNDDNGILSSITATTVRSPQIMLVPGDTTTSGESDQAQSITPGFGNPVMTDNPSTPDANSNLKVDFGFVPNYSLGNRVWKDLDNSGTINNAEMGINGVVLRLLVSPGLTQAVDINGVTVPDQTTAGGGYYRFDNIPRGDYVVEVLSTNFNSPGVLVGCVTSTGTSGIVGSTGPNEPAPDPDNDVDNDDNGEQVGSAVRSKPVTVGEGNGAAEPTNDNDPPTNPLPGEVVNNQSNRTVDFGFTPIMNLGNLVWKDYDNDGIRDTVNPNEPGVSGVKVVLYADTDNSGTFNPPTDVMLAMTVTAADGSYGFNTVLPGNYFVVVDESNFTGGGMLVGCLSSRGHDPGDATDNNDNGVDNPNPPSGGVRSDRINLVGGEEPTNDGDGNNGNLTIDFGFIPSNMVIGNLVWKDLNKNGVRDAGEMPIAGVKVNLYRDVDNSGTFNPPTDILIATTTTGVDGTYRFTGLTPDPYFVQVDASNFGPGQILEDCASSYGSVSGNSDLNDRDHGSDSTGPALNPPISSVVNLVAFHEPPAPADEDDTNGNLTIDFGFVTLLDLTLSDPSVCVGPGDTIQATAVITNPGPTPQGDNLTPEFTATLPAELTGVPGSCTVAGGTTSSCTVTANSVTWNGTIPAGQSVIIKYLTQVGNAVNPGTQFCINSTVNFDSDNNGSNETSVSVQICDTADCPPVAPGIMPPNGSGCSVLIYPIYTSNPANPAGQNTRINLTNINPSKPISTHLFFVDGATCSVADSFICLTPNQTTSFLASDMDPGITGYLVAVAVDEYGCPINFNYLIGDEYVKFDSGHRGNLKTDCVSAVPGGLAPCDNNSVTASLNFDGVSYSRLPMVVGLSNIPSRADGNDTLLILNRLSGNLGNGMDKLNPIFGILYDDAENALSFSFNPGTCQMRGSINNNFPRTVPRFEIAVPSGRSGWMKLYSLDAAMNGAAINNNPGAATNAGAFNGAHSLHHLTQAPSSTMVMPIFPPGCL
jgi:hypothetical protein